MGACCCRKYDYDVQMTTYPTKKMKISDMEMEAEIGTPIDSPLTTSPRFFDEDHVRVSKSVPNRRKNIFISTEDVKHMPHPYAVHDRSSNVDDMLVTVLIDEDQLDSLYFNYERVRSYSL